MRKQARGTALPLGVVHTYAGSPCNAGGKFSGAEKGSPDQ